MLQGAGTADDKCVVQLFTSDRALQTGHQYAIDVYYDNRLLVSAVDAVERFNDHLGHGYNDGILWKPLEPVRYRLQNKIPAPCKEQFGFLLWG